MTMNETILIVDDDAWALKLLNDLLTGEGYSVRPFLSSELALRSIGIAKPKLILLDIRMPHMDGFELCQLIKADQQLKDIPVIFISAANDVDDKVQAFHSGGVDYITKPFQKEEVLARIATHLILRRSIEELQQTSQRLRESEDRLRLAHSIASLGHWEWNIENGIIDWSEQLCQILGCSELGKQTSYDVFIQKVHPDDRTHVDYCLQQVLTGKELELEYRVILPDGCIRHILSKGKLCQSTGDGSLKMIGTAQEWNRPDLYKILGVNLDITDRKELELALIHLANTDALTGCMSRRHFFELAQQEFARACRYGAQFSLIMLDLDHFKQINDQYGHAVGDKVLQSVVSTSYQLLRNVDLYGRLGGEEFAILLPETSLTYAVEVADRLREAVAANTIVLEASGSMAVTVSIGVATLSGADTDLNSLMNRADQALYNAKNTGRNRVVCY